MTDEHREEFERLAQTIARALDDRVGYTIDDVRDAVEAGKMQLWPGQQSAIVTQIMEFPRERVLYFFLAAGNMEEVKQLYHIVIEWGRSKGCASASFAGRKGWERSFLTREEGWTATNVIYEKEI